MGLFKNYVNQTRKPEGFLGKMMVNGMNVVISDLTKKIMHMKLMTVSLNITKMMEVNQHK